MLSLVKGLLLLTVVSSLSLLSSGCFLKYAALVSFEEGDGLVADFEVEALLATCVDDLFEEEEAFIECTYILDFDIGIEVISTVTLLSEFGWFGVLIDPVILQVPEDADDVFGNVTDVSTAGSQPLVVTEVDSFDVQPGLSVSAEPGQKFVILELPDNTPYENVEFNFGLSIFYPHAQSIDIKAIFAGRIDIDGETYYLPLLPCTANFADLPEFTIAVSPQVDLLPVLAGIAGQNTDIGCDGHVYDLRTQGETTPTPTPGASTTPTPTATPQSSETPTPTPIPSGTPQANAIWADDDCNDAVAATDALKKLQDIAFIPYNVEPGCPTLGDTVGVQPAGFGQLIWGDTDCDGDYDAVDALQILRHIAGLNPNQNDPCPLVAEAVVID